MWIHSCWYSDCYVTFCLSCSGMLLLVDLQMFLQHRQRLICRELAALWCLLHISPTLFSNCLLIDNCSKHKRYYQITFIWLPPQILPNFLCIIKNIYRVLLWSGWRWGGRWSTGRNCCYWILECICLASWNDCYHCFTFWICSGHNWGTFVKMLWFATIDQ